MLPALVVFLFVTALIVGAYLVAVPRNSGRDLEQRLREVSSSPTAPEASSADATILKRVAAGPMPALDRLVATTGAGSRLGRLIEQSGVQTSGSAIVLFSIGAAVGFG